MIKKAGSERRAKKEMRRGGIRRVYSGQDNGPEERWGAGSKLMGSVPKERGRWCGRGKGRVRVS
jgi:hypothetical protein